MITPLWGRILNDEQNGSIEGGKERGGFKAASECPGPILRMTADIGSHAAGGKMRVDTMCLIGQLCTMRNEANVP